MFLKRGLVPAALSIVLLCAALTGAAVFTGKRLLHHNEILFLSYGDVNPDIFLMDVDRGLSSNLTRHQSYDGAPSWSPNGEWIAFTSDRDGGLNVFVMDASGRNVRQLTNGNTTFDTPRWSSDGQQLVFFARGSGQTLYSVNSDGSDFRQLTSDTEPVVGVLLDLGIEGTNSVTRVPSPDRTQVLRIGHNGTEWVIYLSNGDFQSEHLLTILGRGYTETPVWSPAGDRVAYVGSSTGRADIYVVNVADGRTKRLTYTQTIETSPTWRP
jgi:TolB protein